VIGLPKTALETPALLVDLDVMEANIAHIAETCREHGVNWRPHTKGQKTIEIIRQELAAGASGVTCAKLSEAAVLAAAGIGDILIANQIVQPAKIARLVALRRHADPIVAVDNPANVAALAAAARDASQELRVVIEVDIGMRRAGVAPGEAVVALADVIAGSRGLRLAGVMAWEAHALMIDDPVAKERAVAAAIAELVASAEAARAAGHSMPIVSCGGTGTFPYCVRQPGVTEVQTGGGIFSDVVYRTKFHVDLPYALTLLATVTSRPTATRIILDAGKKAMSGDAALPAPIGLSGAFSVALSAEHATIELESPSAVPGVGDLVEFIVGYSDTTVHLHEEIIGIRGGHVEAVWSVAGRGRIK
jgi:D-serine deaminase-like pyridoxal phosphate-dependent protein